MTIINHAEYVARLSARYGDQFTVLSEYIGSTKLVTVRCNRCGRVETKKADKIVYRGTCQGCFEKRHTKTHERFVAEIDARYPGEFEVLSQYVADREPVRVRHLSCGQEYSVPPTRLLQRRSCRTCAYGKAADAYRLSQEEYESRVQQRWGGQYTVLGEYKGANRKIALRHNVCGKEYETLARGLVEGKQCPNCARQHLKVRDATNRRMYKSISTRIIHLLRGRKKSNPTLVLLGCSVEELRRHLEGQFRKGMSWENYGHSDGWQVDHIRPCASFDLTDPQQQAECFSFRNLQPMWSQENRAKSSIWQGARYRSDAYVTVQA